MSCLSGPAPELTVAQVISVFLPEDLDRQALPVHHLKVLRRLAQCRSGQLGWTVWQYQQCHRTHWRPHGCGDRHCPSCQHPRSRQRLQEQRRAPFPLRHFHWGFPLPPPPPSAAANGSRSSGAPSCPSAISTGSSPSPLPCARSSSRTQRRFTVCSLRAPAPPSSSSASNASRPSWASRPSSTPGARTS